MGRIKQLVQLSNFSFKGFWRFFVHSKLIFGIIGKKNVASWFIFSLVSLLSVMELWYTYEEKGIKQKAWRTNQCECLSEERWWISRAFSCIQVVRSACAVASIYECFSECTQLGVRGRGDDKGGNCLQRRKTGKEETACRTTFIDFNCTWAWGFLVYGGIRATSVRNYQSKRQ